MNVVDKLIENIIRTKNPTVVGLDPDISKMPKIYKEIIDVSNPFEAVAEVIFSFNKDVIDIVSPYVPAVKPQTAFYEKYGFYGMKALEKTIKYAKSLGLVVIEDAKRNDIGNTAIAYAEGHLGTVELLNGENSPSFDVDFITVSPFLGSESLAPFYDACNKYNKGIFVLVKTSNKNSGEIQDVICDNGFTISQNIAKSIRVQADTSRGLYGYSSIGAVVGATYPETATELRKLMPDSVFLVPGYGAQGGGVRDIMPCFNSDGLGAVVNSSRGVLYDHMTPYERKQCSKDEYLHNVKNTVIRMKNEIYDELKKNYSSMIY